MTLYYKAEYMGLPRVAHDNYSHDFYILLPHKEYILELVDEGEDYISIGILDSNAGKYIGQDTISRTKEKAAQEWRLISEIC